jgi:hypothetical protein
MSGGKNMLLLNQQASGYKNKNRNSVQFDQNGVFYECNLPIERKHNLKLIRL